MDRLQWSSIMLQDSEDFVHSTGNVKIYDGDDKVEDFKDIFNMWSMSSKVTIILIDYLVSKVGKLG